MVFEASTLNVPSTSVDSMSDERIFIFWVEYPFTLKKVCTTNTHKIIPRHTMYALFADKLNKLTHAQPFIKAHFKNENPWATP